MSQEESAPSQGASGGAQKFVEFKLRSTASTNYVHNVMVLSGIPVNMSDFTTPVRLIRDPNNHSDDAGAAAGADADALGGARNKGRFSRQRNRKTRIIYQEDEDEQALRKQESIPWLLEDFDGQHSYVSQLIVPDSKYVIFVNQGNEFRVILASKWYKFTPKLAYRPLTLDEAEERISQKKNNEDFDRWIMKRRHDGGASPREDDDLGTSRSGTPLSTDRMGSQHQSPRKSADSLAMERGDGGAAATSRSGDPGTSSQGTKRHSGWPGEKVKSLATASASDRHTHLRMTKRRVNLEEESFDYTEFVDDDDATDGNAFGMQPDEEDPSMPRIERARPAKSLSAAGKHVKNIVKLLDRSANAHHHHHHHHKGQSPLYSEDEDEGERTHDPYAIKESDDEDDESSAPLSAEDIERRRIKAEREEEERKWRARCKEREDTLLRQGKEHDPNVSHPLPQAGPGGRLLPQKQPSLPTMAVGLAALAADGTSSASAVNRNKRPGILLASGGEAKSSDRDSLGKRSTTDRKGEASRSRSKSPAGGRATSPSAAAGSPPGGGSDIISEAEIIAILREEPMRTKDLIGRIKAKLRADPLNKQIFRDIVRKVAIVRPSASQEEDKLLELKQEFR